MDLEFPPPGLQARPKVSPADADGVSGTLIIFLGNPHWEACFAPAAFPCSPSHKSEMAIEVCASVEEGQTGPHGVVAVVCICPSREAAFGGCQGAAELTWSRLDSSDCLLRGSRVRTEKGDLCHASCFRLRLVVPSQDPHPHLVP